MNTISIVLGSSFKITPLWLSSMSFYMRFSELRTDISYSDNQDVSVLRFGDQLTDGDQDFIDMSGRTLGGTYVAFGFAGNDTIVGGPGNNFLYGGQREDILVGGKGNN